MKYPTIFHLITDITHKTDTRCVLIGGFAVNYYKVTRQTADIDFLITEEDYKKIIGLLEKAGYKQEFLQEAFARLVNVGNSDLMDVDFMFVDKQTFEKIASGGNKISIAAQTFIVPSLHHLIALKLHSLKYNFKLREFKDFPDIINLIRVNKIDCQTKEFRQLCLKYGSEELYNKILGSI